MNRSTWIGRRFREDPLEARQDFLRVAKRCRGSVQAIAIDLGVTERQIRRICWRESLWTAIDKIRAEAASAPPVIDDADWLARTRAALRR